MGQALGAASAELIVSLRHLFTDPRPPRVSNVRVDRAAALSNNLRIKQSS